MQIFDSEKIYNFMKVRYLAFAFSFLIMLVAFGAIFVKGFNYGIDFSGGTLIQLRYDSAAPIEKIREELSANEVLKSASITEFGSAQDINIRYSGSSESLGENLSETIHTLLKDTGKFEIRKVDIVGPKVGGELKQKGIMAVTISLVLILIYIAFRFEWRFAIAAVISEIHDIIVVIGFIAIFQISINLDTLAAILTILGYSLNDTIIIFDRIREQIVDSKSDDINSIINESVSKTLSRTILTSATTLVVVLILYLFGGDMIHDFSLILLVGILFGVYSSVFIAAQTLIWFKFNVNSYRTMLAEKKRKKKEKERMREIYEKGRI